MTDPIRADNKPMAIEVEAGRNYFWCACGKSQKQPFCDGSHRDTDFTPLKYTAEENRKVFFCCCKATAKAPMCDGSHNKGG